MTPRRLGPTALAAALVLAGCSSSGGHATVVPSSSSTTSAGRPPASAPGTNPTSSSSSPVGPVVTLPTVTVSKPCLGTAPRGYSHVVWILMENRAATQVENNPAALYLDKLGRQCGLATGYSAVSHPSLPNYIALTSGGTQGVTSDADPSAYPLGAANLFSLLGSGWRSLEEGMPSACDRTSSGNYAVRHNPAAYYSDLRASCAAQDVALGPVPDVSARFTFITPNLCDDMHDCSTQTGDTWLAQEVPRILSSPQYRSGSTALFITFDENDAGGTHVPFYVVAPSVRPGTTSAAAFDHYSLLRTTEELLGLQPLLGQAATAASLAGAFGL